MGVGVASRVFLEPKRRCAVTWQKLTDPGKVLPSRSQNVQKRGQTVVRQTDGLRVAFGFWTVVKRVPFANSNFNGIILHWTADATDSAHYQQVKCEGVF